MSADKSLSDQSPDAHTAASRNASAVSSTTSTTSTTSNHAGARSESETRKPATISGQESIQDHEERTALRWRRAILRLSETLLSAADERSDLSPILLEAMHNALENLLVYGEEDDLMALEEWLVEGERDTGTHHD